MNTFSKANLSEVIKKLRNRINKISNKNIGEQNTKSTLIEPLLTVLGWDVEELEEVTREFRRKPQDNPVDYALFMFRSPCLFIEAKSLSKDMNDRKWISQTLGYATVVGVEWCVLTNGDEYRIYNSHAAVDVEDKLFRVVSLTDIQKTEYTVDTLTLLTKDKMSEKLLDVYWKSHFIDRRVKSTLEDLLKNEDGGLLRTIKRHSDLSNKDIKESLKRADIQINYPIYTPAFGKPTKKPTVKKPKERGKPKSFEVEIGDLIDSGIITEQLEIQKDYLGKTLNALIRLDKTVEFDGERFDSLSAAAAYARMSVKGAPAGITKINVWRKYPTNGWSFWKYRDTASNKMFVMDVLRQKYLKQKR